MPGGLILARFWNWSRSTRGVERENRIVLDIESAGITARIEPAFWQVTMRCLSALCAKVVLNHDNLHI
jgi:hypothetical protein